MKLMSTFRNASAFAGLVLILALPLTSGAKAVNEKIPLQQHDNIEIIAKHGVFSISGWNENFINLIGQASDDVQVERENSKLVLRLDSVQPSGTSDTLEIKVPSDRKINVISDNADFSFNGLNPRATATAQPSKEKTQRFDADISVSTVDGNVRVTNSSGNFNIQTVNGDIEILESKGVANIKTVSGNQNVIADFRSVHSTNASGQSLYKLRTLDKLNLSNVNGDTFVESAVSQGASIQMQSVKGSIEFLVPESTSARFSLQSHQGGSIKNALNLERDILSNTEGAHVFALADASASVAINTMRGNIVVGYQKTSASEIDDQSYDWSSVDTSLLNFAFVNPNYNILDYQEIFIKQPEIHFDPSWEKKYSKGKKKLYRQRIATEYADLLTAAIANSFSQNKHFKIVNERTENVLVIIPKVLELYIDDPGTVKISDTISATKAGNARIDLVIFSPSDNSILALFMDKRSTARPRGIPTPKSRVRNSRAFSGLFNDWIDDMVKVLSK